MTSLDVSFVVESVVSAFMVVVSGVGTVGAGVLFKNKEKSFGFPFT